MKQGFTPGPWYSSENSEDGTIYIDADTNGDRCVAMILSGSPHNQDIADARLIAAAPDLFEVSTEALSVLTADTIGTIDMDDPDWYARVRVSVGNLQAAITKALGK